jgi:prevent-host-death family protein
MPTLYLREAKQNFARVLHAAAAGEKVVTTRRGVAVADNGDPP